jgi:hypothetical protein
VPDRELDIDRVMTGNDEEPGYGLGAVQDAVDLASGQEQMTWIMHEGRRIAAIVPVDRVAELCLRHLKPVRPTTDPSVRPFHVDGSWCAP